MIPIEPMSIEPVFTPMMEGEVYLPLIGCAVCGKVFGACLVISGVAFHLTRHRPDDPRPGLATCRRCGTVRGYGNNFDR